MRTVIKSPCEETCRIDASAEAAGVRHALEAEGFCLMPPGNDGTFLVPNVPLAVVTGDEWRVAPAIWKERVAQGTTVILVRPDPRDASDLGLRGYRGERDEATLRLDMNTLGQWPQHGLAPSVDILVQGNVSVYDSCAGQLHACFDIGTLHAPFAPGVVVTGIGRGKLLILLFSLSGFILNSRQRSPAAAQRAGGGSAERILLAGSAEQFMAQPQVDLIMAYLCRFISIEMLRLDSPYPRLARLPRGVRRMVTFSMDDLCPSGAPVRQALRQMAGPRDAARTADSPSAPGTFASLVDVIREAACFPANYKHDVRRLIGLFNQYQCTASAFILPFLGRIRNQPALTGYLGFSPAIYAELRDAGWDVGTHINPGSLADYHRVHHAFCRRFGEPPPGHRGHTLGWVGWDTDWQALTELGYSYDSTWSWGGHAGLAWPLGTGYPFHPTTEAGRAYPILEVPLVAWIEDLVGHADAPDPAVFLAGGPPGLYHFGAHSWRIGNPEYSAMIERILHTAATSRSVGVGSNLADICRFWRGRERSRINVLRRDRDAGTLSYEADSGCRHEELAVTVPMNWQHRTLTSVGDGFRQIHFHIQTEDGFPHAVIPHPAGNTRMELNYT